MADLNSILSLLKQAVISLFPAGLDLSNIRSDVIDQVRQEYLTKKTQEEKLKNATTITPEVLAAISNLVKETNLIQVLKKCKERQDKKERELFKHRESIKERYKKQRENFLAKELIGVNCDPNVLQALDREMKHELHRLDLQILKDMDGEVRYLQQEFVKLNVPLFKISNNPNDIKIQQKVLYILQDML
ncbi:uncharacterized protein BX663DRAFT_531751 [Cokeromyces recurvatus]|uniref:uncharacterized protein n=1 Tax=Cokeromyces recurvatus TaxID=90255 RepID=UPI00222108B2|nr:uncharacterized protein BX663DRAFT_531751 [Cokeromyces recurvatus]KAI7901689.1 hypothetical protein BX663DRAFT_531751 [Cokeromyces recurvatus]